MIPSFNGYKVENGNIIRISDNHIMSPICRKDGRKFYKLKDDSGKFKQMTKEKILASIGCKLEVPDNFKKISGTDSVYISEDGEKIISFSSRNPQGIYLKSRIGVNGYKVVNITLNKKRGPIEVHLLVHRTFNDAIGIIYHIDNDKLNNHYLNLEAR